MKMKPLLFSIFLPFLLNLNPKSFAQDSTKTQSKVTNKEGYKRWTIYRTSVRFGIGVQKSFYSEIGVSRLRYFYNDLGYAATVHYAAIEWTPTFFPDKPKNIFGLKVGYELNMRTLALGLETKYQTDGSQNDFVLTPKIGLGFFGVVNVFYGYNISFAGSPFADIGHNQFSVVANLNRRMLSQ